MSLPPPDSVAETGAGYLRQRRSRMLYAILTSGGSKVLAFLVQILALPLALHMLGTGRYAAFLALQSFVGWTGILGLGLVPALPKFIAHARVAGLHDVERNLVQTAIGTMAAISFLTFLVFFALGATIGVAQLIPVHGVTRDELFAGYTAAATASALSLFVSIDPAIRAGGQELHRSNIAAVIANMIVLAGLYFLARHPSPLWVFFVALNMPIAFLLMLDMGLLFIERPHLRSGGALFRKTLQSISLHSNNALLVQMASAMILYLPTVLVARLSDAHQTAIYGSIALELFFGLASMNLIFQPLTAAVANAHSHGDASWLRRSYRISLVLVMAIGLAAIAVAAIFGPWLMRTWMGPSMGISHQLSALFGCFFFLLCMGQLHFFVLSAVGVLPGTGKIYLVQGIVGLLAGSVLCVWYGAGGMALGLVVGMLSTGWFPPLKVRRELRQMTDGASVPVAEG